MNAGALPLLLACCRGFVSSDARVTSDISMSMGCERASLLPAQLTSSASSSVPRRRERNSFIVGARARSPSLRAWDSFRARKSECSRRGSKALYLLARQARTACCERERKRDGDSRARQKARGNPLSLARILYLLAARDAARARRRPLWSSLDDGLDAGQIKSDFLGGRISGEHPCEDLTGFMLPLTPAAGPRDQM
ncbi:hypothetical protein IE81DRAFT_244813 [Ceraceosorus guamensis]|uniref:Uncharacterized protein n=1 Tax=Ceraceosorus guamensis TaxID=1522189 RepID=A0A316VUI4_9BASI|nr:hypothetical protein IE81DRAFT_244813 [Ceraceosorus guamensis]PWN40103.1 hypothetical protein IE81DRAFT_244813 [Ceraceosorus guamensis]